MGVNVSKNVKPQTNEISEAYTEDEKTECKKEEETTTENVRENGQNVRLINDGEEVNDSSETQSVSVVVKNTASRPKFYYYPNKKSSSTKRETIFISTSEFPYKRAKAVYVRPRKRLEEHLKPFKQVRGTLNEGSRYSKFDNTVTCAPDVHSDHKMYVSKGPVRTHHSVNDRHWSSSHVLPTNNYPEDRILPHRAVLELRRSSLPYPATEARYLPGEQYSRHAVEIEPGVVRPPTPSPAAWHPYRRTEDFLVASSLLAGEREMDRRQVMARDANDF